MFAGMDARAATTPENPLGFYFGAAGGRSDLRVIDVGTSHPTGWTAFVGLRPISYLGAELAYIDFGSQSVQADVPTGLPELSSVTARVDSRQRAATASALVYAPLSNLFDLYAKAGVAHMQTRVGVSISCDAGSSCDSFAGSGHYTQTDTRFIYGAGAQVNIHLVAIRLEYQRIAWMGR